MTNILITGCTGFIGSHLVKRLVSDGERVCCFVRKNSNVSDLKRMEVEIVHGDILNAESVYNAFKKMKKIDLVFHLACATGDKGESEDTIWHSNVDGTKNVIDASLKHKVGKFIYFSSIAAYGYSDKPVNEKTPYNGYATQYGKAKRTAEEIVEQYKKKGMKTVIIQPVFVFGPGSKAGIATLFLAIKKKRFCFIGDGSNLIHLCYIANLIDGTLLAAKKSQAVGEKYILGDEQPIPLKELVRESARIMAVKVPNLHIPKWPVNCSMPFLNFLSRFAKHPFSQSRISFLTKSMAGNISKAKRELDYHPKISTKKGIEITVKQLIN